MNPLAAYTGKPYDFNLYNCWHHVKKVRLDAGIVTPDFDCLDIDLINKTFDDAHSDSKGLTQISEPVNYCAVLIARKHRNRLLWHSGVYLDGMVSHCDRSAKQVHFCTLKELQSKSERVEFWQ